MNAFEQSLLVTARSLTILTPFLEERHGHFIVTDKGRLSRFLQKEVGDLMLNDKSGRVWTIEVKAEERFTGNLFLETWSNRNLDDVMRHAEVGSTIGWLYGSRADVLLYHFIGDDKLYAFSFFALKRWAFVHPSKRLRMAEPDASGIRSENVGRIYDFRECVQQRYNQRNQTCGRLVPIKTLQAECQPPGKLFHPRQLALELGDGP
jgi:hypothetical protein